ncbi:MAG TPA: hypothetical protein VEX86_27610 [Longimicrobium sp.]|nr:hypothetical protein [Longimicrobium sp.]
MATRKLNLDVDLLQVDSFEPLAAEQTARGTVEGHAWTLPYCDSQYDRTCNGYGTCGIYPCKPVP